MPHQVLQYNVRHPSQAFPLRRLTIPLIGVVLDVTHERLY